MLPWPMDLRASLQLPTSLGVSFRGARHFGPLASLEPELEAEKGIDASAVSATLTEKLMHNLQTGAELVSPLVVLTVVGCSTAS